MRPGDGEDPPRAAGGAAVLDLAGGCVHELTENQRSDETIFRFLQWLRVDEPEQAPLREAVQAAWERLGPPRHLPRHLACPQDCHQRRENRRLAPEGALLVERRARALARQRSRTTWGVPWKTLFGVNSWNIGTSVMQALREAGDAEAAVVFSLRFSGWEIHNNADRLLEGPLSAKVRHLP
ncbi:unnamed protein product [Symbiodinium natans]|uniref:Uncharacterized protein n=1 Tax=Symbiodinium natans TaxID=878477 RepID=A0A812SWW9_9DINO|nr:unnamed protein product [Symbiodinium natans]